MAQQQRKLVIEPGAELQQRLARAVAQSAALVQMGAALAAAKTAAEVIGVIVAEGTKALDAQALLVSLLSEDGQFLVAQAWTGWSDALIAQWGNVSLQAELPLAEAARLGQVITCRTHQEREERFPLLRQAPPLYASIAALPLRNPEAILGAIGVGYSSEQAVGADDQAFLLALAGQFSQALQRARLHEREQRLRGEAERHASEMDAIIRSVPGGLFIGDREGIHFANPAGLAMLGVEDLAELRLSLSAIRERFALRDAATGQLFGPAHAVISRALLEGIAGSQDVLLRRPNTTEDVVLRVAAAPVLQQGRTVAVVAICTDLTDQRRQAEALASRAEFEKHLIGIVSHDLKNPLAVMMVQAQAVLEGGQLGESLGRKLSRIVSAGRRAKKMIDDLLDFASHRVGGGILVDPQRVDLQRIVAETLDQLRAAHPERQLDYAPASELWGNWDAERLGQVLTNLVSNAIAHGADAPVTVRLGQDDSQAVLTVENRGQPIPAEALPRIFDPFQRGLRGARSADGAGRSIGLGLFIVHAIATAHGGTVEVSSTAEEGTRFRVRLPLSLPGSGG